MTISLLASEPLHQPPYDGLNDVPFNGLVALVAVAGVQANKTKAVVEGHCVVGSPAQPTASSGLHLFARFKLM